MQKIYLTRKQFCLVDDEDFEELNQYRWCAHKQRNGTYYATRHTERENGIIGTVYMHRVIMKTPNGLVTDHINGDQLDNRKCNLRHATRSQNSMNKEGCGKSKYKGVCILVRNFKYKSRVTGIESESIYIYWQAQIIYNGKRMHLGTFKTEVDAALKYNEVALKYHGEFARLNIIE